MYRSDTAKAVGDPDPVKFLGNLIRGFRRLLRISDPRNPDEVSRALLARYGDEAQKMKHERLGLPFTVDQAQAGRVGAAIGRAAGAVIGKVARWVAPAIGR